MGYRSDVCLAIGFKDRDAMRSFIGGVRLADDEWMFKALASMELVKDTEDACIAFYYAGSVKWYDSYDDVQGYERLKKAVEDSNGAWEFIRIGEEEDDTERTHGGEDIDVDLTEYFSLVRSIETPTKGEDIMSLVKGDKP
jgi:hypothetical protein